MPKRKGSKKAQDLEDELLRWVDKYSPPSNIPRTAVKNAVWIDSNYGEKIKKQKGWAWVRDKLWADLRREFDGVGLQQTGGTHAAVGSTPAQIEVDPPAGPPPPTVGTAPPPLRSCDGNAAGGSPVAKRQRVVGASYAPGLENQGGGGNMATSAPAMATEAAMEGASFASGSNLQGALRSSNAAGAAVTQVGLRLPSEVEKSVLSGIRLGLKDILAADSMEVITAEWFYEFVKEMSMVIPSEFTEQGTEGLINTSITHMRRSIEDQAKLFNNGNQAAADSVESEYDDAAEASREASSKGPKKPVNVTFWRNSVLDRTRRDLRSMGYGSIAGEVTEEWIKGMAPKNQHYLDEAYLKSNGPATIVSKAVEYWKREADMRRTANAPPGSGPDVPPAVNDGVDQQSEGAVLLDRHDKVIMKLCERARMHPNMGVTEQAVMKLSGRILTDFKVQLLGGGFMKHVMAPLWKELTAGDIGTPGTAEGSGPEHMEVSEEDENPAGLEPVPMEVSEDPASYVAPTTGSQNAGAAEEDRDCGGDEQEDDFGSDSMVDGESVPEGSSQAQVLPVYDFQSTPQMMTVFGYEGGEVDNVVLRLATSVPTEQTRYAEYPHTVSGDWRNFFSNFKLKPIPSPESMKDVSSTEELECSPDQKIVLSIGDMVSVRGVAHCELDATYPISQNNEGIIKALLQLQEAAKAAALEGHSSGCATLLIISHGLASHDRLIVPSLLACAAVHQYLVWLNLRHEVSIIVEAGDAREVLDVTALLGFGANAVCPVFAFEALSYWNHHDKVHEVTSAFIENEVLFSNYTESLAMGVYRTCSEHGVSFNEDLLGQVLFDSTDLQPSILEAYFPGTASSGIGDMSLTELHEAIDDLHLKAFPHRASPTVQMARERNKQQPHEEEEMEEETASDDADDDDVDMALALQRSLDTTNDVGGDGSDECVLQQAEGEASQHIEYAGLKNGLWGAFNVKPSSFQETESQDGGASSGGGGSSSSTDKENTGPAEEDLGTGDDEDDLGYDSTGAWDDDDTSNPSSSSAREQVPERLPSMSATSRPTKWSSATNWFQRRKDWQGSLEASAQHVGKTASEYLESTVFTGRSDLSAATFAKELDDLTKEYDS